VPRRPVVRFARVDVAKAVRGVHADRVASVRTLALIVRKPLAKAQHADRKVAMVLPAYLGVRNLRQVGKRYQVMPSPTAPPLGSLVTGSEAPRDKYGAPAVLLSFSPAYRSR
jgi:hypothetical protein